jgi:pimeloyl-ACP methyl ester carboxylesterase
LRAERLLLVAALIASALALCAPAPAALGPGEGGITLAQTRGRVTLWRIQYRAHNGLPRLATLVLPRWYGPHLHPRLPLVISPHGRGVSALANARLWGTLPAHGPFAVISPDGEGRKLSLYSWGSTGQIDDLARMPTIVHLTLPWLHVDHHRIYAFGGSMGGQETLLLLGRYPKLLAGAAAFDAVTNFAQQYNAFTRLGCSKACRATWNGPLGKTLQALARREIGGSPWKRPLAYAERSPLTYARTIAASCVPLELWWSVNDRIVLDQRRQTGDFYQRLLALNPNAPVAAFWGFWNHSAEMRPQKRLPAALAGLGLIPPVDWRRNVGLHIVRPTSFSRGCTGDATPSQTATTRTATPAPAEPDAVVSATP